MHVCERVQLYIPLFIVLFIKNYYPVFSTSFRETETSFLRSLWGDRHVNHLWLCVWIPVPTYLPFYIMHFFPWERVTETERNSQLQQSLQVMIHHSDREAVGGMCTGRPKDTNPGPFCMGLVALPLYPSGSQLLGIYLQLFLMLSFYI